VSYVVVFLKIRDVAAAEVGRSLRVSQSGLHIETEMKIGENHPQSIREFAERLKISIAFSSLIDLRRTEGAGNFVD
jgi:hypothetical protein